MCRGVRNVAAGSVWHPSLVATCCPAAPYPGQPGVVGVGMSERQVLETRRRSTGPHLTRRFRAKRGVPGSIFCELDLCPLPQDSRLFCTQYTVCTRCCLRSQGAAAHSKTRRLTTTPGSPLSLLVPAGPRGAENRPIPAPETHKPRVQLPGRHKAKQTSWLTVVSAHPPSTSQPETSPTPPARPAQPPPPS